MSLNNNWINITDVNERKKAQNRVAQRNYRTRQKRRIKFAEAVLSDMPHLNWASVLVDQNQKKGHRSAVADDKGDSSSSSASPLHIMAGNAETKGPQTDSSSESNKSGFDPSVYGLCEGQSQTALPPHYLDLSGIFPDFPDGFSLDLSANSLTTDADCINPPQSQKDWIDIEPYPPPLMSNSQEPLRGNFNSNARTTINISPSEEVSRPNSWSPNSNRRVCGDIQTMGFRESPSSFYSPSSSISPSSPLPHTIATPSSAVHAPAPLRTIDEVTELTSSQTAGIHALSVNTSYSPTTGAAIAETTSPLLMAISLKNLQIAHLLVRSGAKLDVPDRNGKTALHLAVERGELTTARLLLDLGADVLATDLNGRGVLHKAVERDEPEIVKMVLMCCDGQCENDEMSLRLGNAHKLDVRVRRRGSDLIQNIINAKDGRGLTALHLCVLSEKVDILKILLEYGANVNL